jgi:hypothetical protein
MPDETDFTDKLNDLADFFVSRRNQIDKEQLDIEATPKIDTLEGKETFCYLQGQKEGFNEVLFYIEDTFGLRNKQTSIDGKDERAF